MTASGDYFCVQILCALIIGLPYFLHIFMNVIVILLPKCMTRDVAKLHSIFTTQQTLIAATQGDYWSNLYFY